jgi:hypothetical protein
MRNQDELVHGPEITSSLLAFLCFAGLHIDTFAKGGVLQRSRTYIPSNLQSF